MGRQPRKPRPQRVARYLDVAEARDWTGPSSTSERARIRHRNAPESDIERGVSRYRTIRSLLQHLLRGYAGGGERRANPGGSPADPYGNAWRARRPGHIAEFEWPSPPVRGRRFARRQPLLPSGVAFQAPAAAARCPSITMGRSSVARSLHREAESRSGRRSRQRGAVLLAAVTVTLIVGTSVLLARVGSSAAPRAREAAATARALAEARRALVGWSIGAGLAAGGEEHVPGVLPFPDRNSDPGGYDGTADCVTIGLSDRHLIGRLARAGGDLPVSGPGAGRRDPRRLGRAAVVRGVAQSRQPSRR